MRARNVAILVVAAALAVRAGWRWLGTKADEEIRRERASKLKPESSRWDEDSEETTRLDRIAPEYGTTRRPGESNEALGERLHGIVDRRAEARRRAIEEKFR